MTGRDREPAGGEGPSGRGSGGPAGGPPRGGVPPWRGGPPWRADGGGFDPWDPNDPWAPEMWRRRVRFMRRMDRQRLWHPRQGFGCLFAFFFLIVAGSLVAVAATVLSTVGPIAAVIVGLTVIGLLFGMGRTIAIVALTLDGMLDATRRVALGDYSIRIGAPRRQGLRSLRELAGGFDAMVARLEADEEQRRSLLADVSHELRTPLAVIAGNLEAILDGVYPADPAHLAPILDETRVMERLIDDLRTVALSEAGTLTMHPEPTDPDVLIGEVIHAFTPGAAAAGVTLTTQTTSDLPILDLDPVRIREVLSNLVANALRHTPSGGSVTVGGAVTATDVTLAVSDTGPGIDPALLPHIFDRFVKGAGSRGSGLGLAIARALVEAHGGTISVDSAAGAGTSFHVVLPRTSGS